MSLVSSLADAEDGLLSALSGAGLGITVQLGNPGAQVKGEIVWIDEQARADWDPEVTANVPPPTFSETFELEVHILTLRRGDDYTTLRNRATALAESCELAIAADPSLGGAVMDAYIVSVERSTGAFDVGRGIETVIAVHGYSYLA